MLEFSFPELLSWFPLSFLMLLLQLNVINEITVIVIIE